MKRILVFLLIVICSQLFTVAGQDKKQESPNRLAIRAGRLIDTKNGSVINNAVILIEGEKITAVGEGLSIPAGVEVIDLRNKTVLAGLIDCHTHITFQPGNYYEDLFRKSPIDFAVMAHVYARRT